MSAPTEGEVRRMHTTLDRWGVVDSVRYILMQQDRAKSVSEVCCWVEAEEQYGTQVVIVKVTYMLHPHSVPDRVTQPRRLRASFRVAAGMPFGPVGSAPLTYPTVRAIYKLAGVKWV